jgi:hypothetical protein
MPWVVDLFGLEEAEIMRWFETRAARFDQDNAPDAAGQADGQGDTDRPRTHDRNLGLRRATIGQALTAPDHAIDDNNSLRCWRVLTPMIAAVTKSGAIAADNAACGDQFWFAPPSGLRRTLRTKSPILR